jgi:ribosomal protein S27AE
LIKTVVCPPLQTADLTGKDDHSGIIEDMLEGTCPKCGYHCAGWALRFPQNQMCPKCGTGLELSEGGRKVSTGYSPFTADKYFVDMPSSEPTPQDKEKSSRKQNKRPPS